MTTTSQSPRRSALGGLGPILVAAGVTTLVAWAGGALTDLGPWYQALEKPPWQPPDWAFPVAWTTIFALTAIAAVLSWRAAEGRPRLRGALVGLFLVNGALNVAWSGLFFALQRPDWGLYEVPFLWISILALMVLTARASRLASLLLAPYLVWVGVAAVLNWEVVARNGPFGL